MDTSSWSLPSQSNGMAGMNSWLQLYLCACKLLDLAMALPAENLPQFQMYKWAFIGGPVSQSPDNESRVTSFSEIQRLSVPSPSARLSHSEDNLHRGGSRTPSPSPSKISTITRTSTLFEPHIVRIEKIFRKKVCFATDSSKLFDNSVFYAFSESIPRIMWKRKLSIVDVNFNQKFDGTATFLHPARKNRRFSIIRKKRYGYLSDGSSHGQVLLPARFCRGKWFHRRNCNFIDIILYNQKCLVWICAIYWF